ncbi:MAG: sensor histidine kinase KdpD [Phycisphaerae bacterium]|jgi:two-component system sensor histidine kinase KdpD
MTDQQSHLDEPLEQIRQQVQASRRGRLKIFFGYAAGVGKTYSMLEAARAQAAAGAAIVLGYVEPHARPETEAMTLDMETLPPKLIEHRGITIKEFDLDAALARKPAILVADELAHTNAPTSRHAKRWQDVEELLEAGINVYSTLNVQHVESLNDIVTQISGIQVRETIPDSVFDQAESIELVDLPPEELLQRFREGKVYVPAQAESAMQRFFKLPNLIALRELALRRVADRVNVQVQAARHDAGGTQVWATSERLLVCVGPSPTSARVIRIAKRMASALRAVWIAAHVDTGSVMDDATQQKLTRNLNLAEQLGAETVTLSGQDVADEIVKYAHARNVTKIVIGKTGLPRWREMIGRSVVNQVLHRSGDIDVYVIRGREEPTGHASSRQLLRAAARVNRVQLAMAVVVAAACTGVAGLMRGLWPHLSEANQVMLYFLGIAFVAVRYGRWPGVLVSILSVLAFDFFFVPPYMTFAVHDTQYFITFCVMLVISLLISGLASRIRRQANLSRQRERRTEALYRLSRKLAGTAGTHQLVAAAETELAESYASEVAVFLPDKSGYLKATAGGPASFTADDRELAVAQWCFDHGQFAGAGTDTLPNAHALYVPLASPHGTVGVLALRSLELGRFDPPQQRQLLQTLASQIALAIERDSLAEQAQKVLVQAETERLRSSLLSSVSHDLRTPLAVIAGASSSLAEEGQSLSDATRRELLQTIVEESSRLALLVDNLLHITRIESGAVEVNRQWYPLEEIVGSALERTKKSLAGRQVKTHLPSDLPLVKLDGVLIEQVLINLLENVAKYTPAGSEVDVLTHMDGSDLLLEVADRGPGLSDAERQRVFDKFYRGAAAAGGQRGAGLGLAICRAIATAHGGRIWQEDRPGGGARFILSIPQGETPPAVDGEIAPEARTD